MTFSPCVIRSSTAGGDARFALGDPLVDRYLAFVAGRSRPNTLRAVAFDLKTFFLVVAKDPLEVVAADVFDFLAHQRGDRTVVRMSDRESGLSARTIARRLSSVSGLQRGVRADRRALQHCRNSRRVTHRDRDRRNDSPSARSPRPHARQRAVHPPRRTRMPHGISLRDLHLFPDRTRVRPHHPPPTRPRPRPPPTRPCRPLRSPPRQSRTRWSLTRSPV
jgi:hypothetical protein